MAASRSYAEALRRLGMCATGGGNRTLKKYVELWDISTAHFDPDAARMEALSRHEGRPIEELLVEGTTVSRGNLKRRLYRTGLKTRVCELCGQDEHWQGRRMSLILDHVNGVADDNRLENLRIVCPNCAATLPTHCGRNIPRERICATCDETFEPNRAEQRYCSAGCGVTATCSGPKPERRKAGRPPIRQLLCEIGESSYREVGRRYGVSDNAIRKWLRVEGVEPPRVHRPRSRANPPGAAPGRGRERGRARPPRSR